MCIIVRTQVFLWRHLMNELVISLIVAAVQLNGEMASINCKVEKTEADYADLSARLQAATLKMEETVKAADEFERFSDNR